MSGRWLPDGACAFQRDDGRYMINRAPQSGFPAVYMLVKLGRKVTTSKGGTLWTDSEIIGTARAEDDGERKQAVDSLMGLCDE